MYYITNWTSLLWTKAILLGNKFNIEINGKWISHGNEFFEDEIGRKRLFQQDFWGQSSQGLSRFVTFFYEPLRTYLHVYPSMPFCNRHWVIWQVVIDPQERLRRKAGGRIFQTDQLKNFRPSLLRRSCLKQPGFERCYIEGLSESEDFTLFNKAYKIHTRKIKAKCRAF